MNPATAQERKPAMPRKKESRISTNLLIARPPASSWYWMHINRIRILLADDNDTMLTRVRTILSKEADVVGTVRNGWDAIAEVQRLDPDVLLIDISMPLLDGLQAVARLGSSIRTKVVFLTAHEDQDFVDAAFAAGASGFVAKSDGTTDLLPSIHAVLEGRQYVSKSIASKCVSDMREDRKEKKV